MRADFLHYYRLRLDDVVRVWPIGEVADLACWLPPEAALWRSVDPDGASWTEPRMTAELLAQIVDRVSFVSWQLGADEDTPAPDPLPRPWLTPTEETPDDMALVGDVVPLELAAETFFPDRVRSQEVI